MVRIRHSASERPRVRLLSTPHPEGPTMTTAVAGIRFSDQLAALLTHAVAHGFRVEKDERGKNSKGVVVYAPDRDHPPITVDERGGRFNRAHYENVRRDLYRAGLPPLPTADNGATAAPRPSEDAVEAAMLAEAPPGSKPLRLGPIGLVETPDLTSCLDGDSKGLVVGKIASALAERVGVGLAEAALVASVLEVIIDWTEVFSADRLNDLRSEITAGLVAKHEKDMKAATDLAEEAERARVAADRARERAEARGAETGRLLTEALAAKDAAEAEARRLNAAIAPLRALMSDSGV